MRYVLALLLSAFSFMAGAQNVNTFIPPRAELYLPTVYKEAKAILPDYKFPNYFGALIEHESCISLTHSRCWSPTSELKTSREQGVGFGQLTRAWDSTGKLRFDALTELVVKNRLALDGLNWDTIKTRPDLQIRAVMLLWRDNYNRLGDVTGPMNRTRMADAAYNGGLGSVNTARSVCAIKTGCNSQYWFDNVEKYQKTNQIAPIYAGRSARDINLHHVKDVTVTRWKKYEDHFANYQLIESK